MLKVEYFILYIALYILPSLLELPSGEKRRELLTVKPFSETVRVLLLSFLSSYVS